MIWALLSVILCVSCGAEPSFNIDQGDASGDKNDSDGTEEDAGADSDTDTDADSDSDTDSDSNTDTDTDMDVDTDTDSDSDTDTSLCPWECRPNIGFYSCDNFDTDVGPEWVRNWNFDCPHNDFCCQHIDAAGGISDYCMDFDDTACFVEACDEKEQNLSRYCNGPENACCLKN